MSCDCESCAVCGGRTICAKCRMCARCHEHAPGCPGCPGEAEEDATPERTTKTFVLLRWEHISYKVAVEAECQEDAEDVYYEHCEGSGPVSERYDVECHDSGTFAVDGEEV